MANVIDTGNETVDSLGQLNLTGNIIPANWYKTILRDNGKPYLLAICILSEICYWYRPTEERDERTGFVRGYKKKFADDYLQKSYQELANLFGETKRSVKAAIDRLEEIGVITRVWRNKVFENGGAMTNILYIDLNVDKLYEITFEEQEAEEEEKRPENPVNKHITKKCNIIPQNNVGHPTKKCDIIPQNNARGVTKKRNIIPQNDVGHPTPKRGTNTKSTTENTYKDYTENTTEITNRDENINPISSFGDKKSNDSSSDHLMERMEETRELIRDNIDYDAFADNPQKYNIEQLDELIEIMVEACVLGRDERISGNLIPHGMIISRFEKYNMITMEYVLLSLASNTTVVKNTRKYLLATLYNAPNTVGNYYKLLIQHDMKEGFERRLRANDDS